MARECKIKKSGGKITIQMTVNNGIISGGDFSIYEFDTGIVIHTFKMHTGTNGKVSHELPLKTNVLTGKVLSWQVLSCTPIVTDSCKLNIEIFQDGMKCPMNKDAHYDLSNIPSCTINQATPVKGGLYFVNQFTTQGI
jgi:hypothetical protein